MTCILTAVEMKNVSVKSKLDFAGPVMAAQMITVINRLCCTFACKTYQIGPKKRVGIFLTCTGSEPEEMKRHVKNILTLPSVSRAISEYRTEVFTQCVSDSTCRDRADYLERAERLHAGHPVNKSIRQICAGIVGTGNFSRETGKTIRLFSVKTPCMKAGIMVKNEWRKTV